MSSSAIQVRFATPDDAAVIADFNIAMAKETESIELDHGTVHAGVIKGINDSALYFVAESAGRIVGCCMVTREWSDWRNGDIWWLQSVYVHPDFRRAGVFRAMYQHVERAAVADEVVMLRLYVEQDNHRAQRTYQAMGMSLAHYLVMEKGLGEGGQLRPPPPRE
jgi:ribosomal protein S18 acetylase RimI-like enzyme